MTDELKDWITGLADAIEEDVTDDSDARERDLMLVAACRRAADSLDSTDPQLVRRHAELDARVRAAEFEGAAGEDLVTEDRVDALTALAVPPLEEPVRGDDADSLLTDLCGRLERRLVSAAA